MKTNVCAAAAFVGLLLLIHPSPAAASFTVCNHSSYAVTAAFAAKWYVSEADNIVAHGSQGWYNIARGDCAVLTAIDISRDDIYIYAFATSHTSKTWSGQYTYCLDPNHRFTYRDPDATPPCGSGRSFGMRYVETGGESSFIYTLID